MISLNEAYIRKIVGVGIFGLGNLLKFSNLVSYPMFSVFMSYGAILYRTGQ